MDTWPAETRSDFFKIHDIEAFCALLIPNSQFSINERIVLMNV